MVGGSSRGNSFPAAAECRVTGISSVRIEVLADPPPAVVGGSPGGSSVVIDHSFYEGAGPRARAFFFAPNFQDVRRLP
jgi:hypothetical protein